MDSRRESNDDECCNFHGSRLGDEIGIDESWEMCRCRNRVVAFKRKIGRFLSFDLSD